MLQFKHDNWNTLSLIYVSSIMPLEEGGGMFWKGGAQSWKT